MKISISISIFSIFLVASCLNTNFLGYVDTDLTDTSFNPNDTDTNDTETGSDTSETGTDTEPDWEECASDNLSIGLIPLDILFALDTSYSMDYSPDGELLTKWEAVKSAIKSFVKDEGFEGIGVGLQYFPLRKLCSVEAYSVPAVEISQLPDAADALIESLDSQRMANGTPMFPMLKGALKYATEWAEMEINKDRKAVIIMATDGIPDKTCVSSDAAESNTLENVEALVKEAAEADEPINTFVIGVGKELSALNSISKAGNGQDAILIDLEAGNVEQTLLDALETIRRRSICEYLLVDVGQGQSIDPAKVNILFTDENVTKEPFVFVNTEAGCSLTTEKGWYYDDQNNPTKIILCPDTCARVQERLGNELDFVLGCNTIPVE